MQHGWVPDPWPKPFFLLLRDGSHYQYWYGEVETRQPESGTGQCRGSTPNETGARLRSPWGGKGRKAPAWWWCEAACSCTTALIPSLYCQLLWARYSTTHAWINTISDCCYCYLLLEILYCNILTPPPCTLLSVWSGVQMGVCPLKQIVWVYDNNYMGCIWDF